MHKARQKKVEVTSTAQSFSPPESAWFRIYSNVGPKDFYWHDGLFPLCLRKTKSIFVGHFECRQSHLYRMYSIQEVYRLRPHVVRILQQVVLPVLIDTIFRFSTSPDMYYACLEINVNMLHYLQRKPKLWKHVPDISCASVQNVLLRTMTHPTDKCLKAVTLQERYSAPHPPPQAINTDKKTSSWPAHAESVVDNTDHLIFKWTDMPRDLCASSASSSSSQTSETKDSDIGSSPSHDDFNLVNERVQVKVKADLYKYQLATVAWMLKLEQRIEAEQVLEITNHWDLEWHNAGPSTFPAAEFKTAVERVVQYPSPKDTTSVFEPHLHVPKPEIKVDQLPYLVDWGGSSVVTLSQFMGSKGIQQDDLRVIWHTYVPSSVTMIPEFSLSFIPKYADVSFQETMTSPVRPPQIRRFVRMKGGILADEMGLGKSLTLISLIACNPAREHETLTAGDRVQISSGEGLKQQTNREYLKTKASLIVCPNQLAEQWKNEIVRFSNPARPLKLVICMTKLHHKRLKYKDVAEADIVLVSREFLVGKYYDESSERASTTLPDPDLFSVGRAAPHFHQFWWRRVILDEAHEVDAQQLCRQMMSDFRWYVSATPFAEQAVGMAHALKFLQVDMMMKYPSLHQPGKFEIQNRDITFSMLQNPQGVMVDELIRKHLFCRSTKDSIGTENKITEYTEELVLIDPSDVDKIVYEISLKIQRSSCTMLQKLCAFPPLATSFCTVMSGDSRLYFTSFVSAKDTTTAEPDFKMLSHKHMIKMYWKLIQHHLASLEAEKASDGARILNVRAMLNRLEETNSANQQDLWAHSLHNNNYQMCKNNLATYTQLHRETSAIIQYVKTLLPRLRQCKGWGVADDDDDTLWESDIDSECDHMLTVVPDEHADHLVKLVELSGCTKSQAAAMLKLCSQNVNEAALRIVNPEDPFTVQVMPLREHKAADDVLRSLVAQTQAYEDSAPSHNKRVQDTEEEDMQAYVCAVEAKSKTSAQDDEQDEWTAGAPQIIVSTMDKKVQQRHTAKTLDDEEIQHVSFSSSSSSSACAPRVKSTYEDAWMHVLPRSHQHALGLSYITYSASPQPLPTTIRHEPYNSEFKRNLSSWGLKLATLIKYLQDIRAKSTVQTPIKFTSFLKTIKDVLERNNIHALFCAGNVWQKSKAIRGFQGVECAKRKHKAPAMVEPATLSSPESVPKSRTTRTQVSKKKQCRQDMCDESEHSDENTATMVGTAKSTTEPNVLLMGLESTASGINLKKTTHIILMEPAGGSRSHAHAVESQAISRALRQAGHTLTGECITPLTVVRLVVRGTIEQQLFERNRLKQEDCDMDNLLMTERHAHISPK